MRPIFTTLILTMLAQPMLADTTNREKQLSPVPGLFVGGVGLECRSNSEHIVKFLLLTKDRKTLSVAKFDNDDVTYDFWPITETSPQHYIARNEGKTPKEVRLNRQNLSMTFGGDFKCKLTSISDLHKIAADHLRSVLNENKI